VKEMIGVDATEQIVERGREICRAEGLDECISFVLGDACATGLPAGEAEFVWGEDAWCYVEDKRALIVEAARLLRPGGTIAFTDWVEGPAGLEAPEAERLLRFMRFPSILNIDDYRRLFSVGKTPDRGLGRYRAIRPLLRSLPGDDHSATHLRRAQGRRLQHRTNELSRGRA
jgi:SAM-dependent methyltransferase